MKNLLKSRWFLLYLMGILLTTALTAAGSYYLVNEAKEENSVNLSEFAGGNIEEIIPLGRYRTIKILSGEKELFLGEKKGKENKWYIFDRDGNELADIPVDGTFEKKNNKYILFYEEEKYLLVKYDEVSQENHKVEIKKYSYADIDENGENYISYNKDRKTYEVWTPEDKVLYSIPEKDIDGDHPVKFAEKNGYLLKTKNSCDHIINYMTGKDENKAKKNSTVCDYVAGRWIIDIDEKTEIVHTVKYQVLNDHYEDVSGVTSSFYYGNENLLAIRGHYGKDMLCDTFGHDVETEKYGMCIADAENAIAYYDNQCINYLTMVDGKIKVMDKQKFYCRMAFEDGFSKAYKGKDLDIKDFQSDDFMNNGEEGWGFVDENMNPATEFVFSAVTEPDNRYAVVGVGRKQGLIRLKEVEK